MYYWRLRGSAKFINEAKPNYFQEIISFWKDKASKKAGQTGNFKNTRYLQLEAISLLVLKVKIISL